MGYYTEYNLKTSSHPKDTSKNYCPIELVLKEQLDFEGLSYAINEYGDGIDFVKWYSHKEDMIDLSKKYPTTLFILSGTGEDCDKWKEYFYNGKSQFEKAVITYGECQL